MTIAYVAGYTAKNTTSEAVKLLRKRPESLVLLVGSTPQAKVLDVIPLIRTDIYALFVFLFFSIRGAIGRLAYFLGSLSGLSTIVMENFQ